MGETVLHCKSLSRRGFLAGTGLLAAGAAASMVGCSSVDKSELGADYLPEKWDYETDVVIVGYGGAGAAAAITMASEGLGEFIVIEAAPEKDKGGNTRVSGNIIMIPDDVEGAIEYQTALNGVYTVEEDILRAWAENLCGNKEWLEGLDVNIEPVSSYSPEFPECPGGESIKCYCVDGMIGNNSLWNALMELEEEYGYEVFFDTRATSLVRNPTTNEALGVIADQNDSSIAIKARKGVVLTCGGFENNPEMKRDNFPASHNANPFGTPYNRGDGFKLVSPFGAQLWHLNSFAGAAFGIWVEGFDSPNVCVAGFGNAQNPLHDYIIVGQDGKRFTHEESGTGSRHGKISLGGNYVDLHVPNGAWAIFDQLWFDNVSFNNKKMYAGNGWVNNNDNYLGEANDAYLEAGVIVKADTIEELAEKTGIEASGLKATIETYNNVYVANQNDEDFGRGRAIYSNFGGMGFETVSAEAGEEVEVVPAFDLVAINPPYYATPIPGSIHNTQGGPKRNGNCQTLDGDDEVIPRLYNCGEFGTIYGYMYNGGGNVSDAIATGRVAVRHAASLDPWDGGAEE